MAANPEADPATQAPPWAGLRITPTSEIMAMRQAVRSLVPYLSDWDVVECAAEVLDCREAGQRVRITRELPPEVRTLLESAFNGNGRPDPEGAAQQQAERPAAEALAITRLSEIEVQDIQWAWPGRFPLRKPSIISGDPGLGKSLIALDIIARVTRGRPWPDGSGNAPQGNAIILSAEDDAADTIRPRLEAAGADCTRVFIVEAVRRVKGGIRSFILAEDLDLLAHELERIGDVLVVVVDPISAYLGTLDSHKNADLRGAVLAPLAELAAKHGPAIITISHLNKGAGPAIYRTTGSLAFVAAARAAWAVAKDQHSEDGRRLMLPVKCNLAPDQEGLAYRILGGKVPTIEWLGPVTVDVNEALTTDIPEERNACAEAMEWLRKALGNGSVAATQIRADARANGIAERTLWRAKKKVGAVAEKIGTSWFWKLSGIQVGQGCQPCHPGMSGNSGILGTLERAPAPGEGAEDL